MGMTAKHFRDRMANTPKPALPARRAVILLVAVVMGVRHGRLGFLVPNTNICVTFAVVNMRR